MYKQAIVYHEDGTKEYIDPVLLVRIDNGYFNNDYDNAESIVKIEFIDIEENA